MHWCGTPGLEKAARVRVPQPCLMLSPVPTWGLLGVRWPLLGRRAQDCPGTSANLGLGRWGHEVSVRAPTSGALWRPPRQGPVPEAWCNPSPAHCPALPLWRLGAIHPQLAGLAEPQLLHCLRRRRRMWLGLPALLLVLAVGCQPQEDTPRESHSINWDKVRLSAT